MAKAIYLKLCPNCKGDAESWRLERGIPCSNCSEDPGKEIGNMLEAYDFVRKKMKVEEMKEIDEKLEEINELFKKYAKNEMWPIQRSWAIKVLRGESFSISAPTGVGKSVFGSIISYYLAKKMGKRCYIILPTNVLVNQVYKIIEEVNDGSVRVLAYSPNIMKSSEAKRRISDGDFDVLITTSQFLARNFELMRGKKFDFLFVDDVDSFLKAHKNIYRSLLLVGFKEDDIERAYEALRSGKIESFEVQRPHGQIVISSATGRTRGRAHLLYRILLNFTIGSTTWQLRNVINFEKICEDPIGEACKIAKKLGSGGLFFVPHDLGHEFAKRVCEELRSSGIKAEVISPENKIEVLEEFINGNLEAMVGVAHYYGILVRGVNLPEQIKYAVFVKAPRFKFNLRELNDFQSISTIILRISKYLGREEQGVADYIRVWMRRIARPQIEEINRALLEGAGAKKYEKLIKTLRDAREIILRAIEDPEIRGRIEKEGEVILREEGGSLYIYLPDVKTYIQASGRTSRTYVGGITRGISLILEDDPPILAALRRVFKYYLEEEWEELNWEKLLQEFSKVEEDRRKVRLASEGKLHEKMRGLGRTALFIVESPNKAKTIARFYGRPGRRIFGRIVAHEVSRGDLFLIVVATVGHLLDLPIDERSDWIYGIYQMGEEFVPCYATIKKCNSCGYQFSSTEAKCPMCGSSDVTDKMENVEKLRDLAMEVDEILIGTDPDTEGEKIAWDVYNVLRPINPNIRRVEFHEVTKRAIEEAIENKREIDHKLVEAQIVRRIEDRWIGFGLSRKLWERFELGRWLSAGRVQTPVLGWIIQRAEEAKKRVPRSYVKLENGLFLELDKRLRRNSTVYAYVQEVREEEIQRSPLPPFTTDSMLSEASSKLKLSVNKVMSLAQDLFEAGLCLTPECYVILEDGRMIRIQEAVDGEEKFLLGVRKFKERRSMISRHWWIRWEGKIRRISLENGYYIRATPDHGILIKRGGQIKWASAKYVKPGDKVAFIYNYRSVRREGDPRRIEKILGVEGLSFKLSEEAFYASGFLLGSGGNLKKLKELEILSEEIEKNLEEIKERMLSKMAFGGDIRPEFFSIKEEYIDSFLAGYIDSCGRISEEGDLEVEFDRESGLKFGIYLYMSGIKNELEERGSRILIRIKKSEFSKFVEKIGRYLRIRWEELRRPLKSKEIRREEESGPLTWIKVRKVEDEDYSGYVYDFTTSTENFFSNGMLSHNCTYHRTDSHRVSEKGIQVAKEYIQNSLREDLFKPRTWGTGGAHECIRPTRPWDTHTLIDLIKREIFVPPKPMTRDHFRLYDLIFKRFMASQMREEKVLRQKALLVVDDVKVEVEGDVEILEPTFSQIYKVGKIIPRLREGETLKGFVTWSGMVKAVKEYSQAEVIRLMKERGLGRPSTYAKIVETLLKRRYVIDRNGLLIPTKLGIEVYQFLTSKYPEKISEERTRILEEKMEKVASGEVNSQELLQELYSEMKEILQG